MTTEGTAMYTQTLLAPTSAPTASVADNPSAPTANVDTATAAAAAAAAAASVANAAASVAPQPADPKTANPATSTPIVTAPSAATTAAAVHPPHPPQMPMAAAAFGQYPPSVMFGPPDPTVMDDQPTYVNPKQYARILKRRESRKKQTGTDVTSYTPRKRSYMHESRHKHAMQRRRGPGGRFLSKEEREIKESQAAAQ